MRSNDIAEESRGRVSQLPWREAALEAARRGVGSKQLRRLVETHREAVERAGGGALESVPIEESVALEAIVRRTGRPPLLVVNDRIQLEELPALPADAPNKIKGVEGFVTSVGRIDFVNHRLSYGGTGWIVDRVGPRRKLVVTNRHVASLVARRLANGSGVFLRSPVSGALYGARIDFREEAGSVRTAQFELPVERVVYLADNLEADVALLEISTSDGLDPEPLPLASKPAEVDELVATVGYPAYDDRHDGSDAALDALAKYFQDLFDVKRFAPGLVTQAGNGRILSHDCTTLGGNSGSGLISLDQKGVVGLHFAGKYGVENSAVGLATLERLKSTRRLFSAGAALASERTVELQDESLRDGEHRRDDLRDRDGYNPDHLGRGRRVDWPSMPDHLIEDLAVPSDRTDAKPHELRYTNFGVLFSTSRMLPRVTAVNIDGNASRRIKRDSDKWYFDLRIPKELQLGQEYYASDKVDRGHMVRREDPNWGDMAERANADTFHYTNSAPQHSSLNQGKTLWQGLENYILDSARTKGFCASVFTGPVFRDDDPPLEPSDVPAPLEFWKIVVMEGANGGLHATGYLLSQGQLIRDLLERQGRTEAVEGFVLGEYRTFQVAIGHIEEATQLRFGDLDGADPLVAKDAAQEALADGHPVYVPLEAPEQLVL